MLHLARVAERSMVLMCAAVLCLAACKKEDKPAADKSGVAPGSAAAPKEPPAGGNKLVIGVLSDMSGPYADLGGAGSIAAAEMAVAEVGGSVAGMQIEIVSADHQNKADIGSNIAREWYDTKNVDVIVDVPTSSVALAISPLTA